MEKSISKRLFSLILVLAMVFTFIPVNNEFKADAAVNPVPSGFHVSGTKILDSNGNEFVMRGINHAYLWFKAETDTALKAIASKGANTVRLVMSTGKHEQYKPGEWNDSRTTASEVENCIQSSLNNGLVPIVEVHDATGVDSYNALQDCADYWMSSDIKSVLNKYSDKAILNIANEWQGNHGASSWADSYKKVIPQLRNAGIKNMIMVDSAGWGQSSDAMSKCGEVFNADSEKNTIFSIHMYSCFYRDDQVTSLIDKVLQQNVPLVVGEFGHEHSGTKVAYKKIFSYCDEKNIGWVAWSWKGNGGTDANLDLSNDWAGNNLTSWGQEVCDHLNPFEDRLTVSCVATAKYTGKAITPAVTVKYGSNTLSSNDYSVEYFNNVEVGTASVKVTGKNSYAGKTAETTFRIVDEENEDEIEIWSGNVDLNDWNGMAEIATAKFKEVSSSNTVLALKVYYESSVSADIQLAYNDANNKWQKIVDYEAASGTDHTFSLTTDNISALNDSKGIFVKGSAGTVVRVTAKIKPNGKRISDCKITVDPTVVKIDDDQVGTEIKPDKVTVTYDGTVLTENKDYTLSYSDNTKPGTAKVTVKGMGEYKGSATKTFKIQKKYGPIGIDHVDYWEGSFVCGNFDKYLEIPTGIGSWANAELTVEFEATGSGEHKLQFAYADEKKGAWSYMPGTEEDECCVEATGSSYTFTLDKAQIAELENAQKLYFKGKNITLKKVYVEGAILGGENDSEHTGTVAWEDVLDFPNWDVMLRIPDGLSDYVDMNLAKEEAFIRVDFEYNNDSKNASMQLAYGDPDTGKFTVMIDAVQPRSDSYTFRLTPAQISTLANAKEIIIKGAGFTANKVTFITPKGEDNRKSIKNCTVSVANSEVTYTGSAIKPAVTVKDGSKTLTAGTDYTVSYSNNVEVGTATATVTGKGDYKDSKSVSFKIVKNDVKTKLSDCDVNVYPEATFTGTTIKQKATIKDGSKTLVEGTDYTIAYKDNAKVGKATMTITGKGNYEGKVTKNFTILRKSIKYCTVTIGGKTVKNGGNAGAYKYKGTAIKPTVRVFIGNGEVYKGNYTVTYKNNVKKGTATIVVTAKSAGSLNGKTTYTFSIK